MNDTITIGERYSSATDSSNLRVSADSRGDADLLIAAGWADSLGSLLMRLHAEFDMVRAGIRAHPLNLTERLLVLQQLKSLPAARQELGRYATVAATKRRFMVPDAEVAKLVGRVLDVFLDPVCHKCEGTGRVGEFGGVRSVCSSCGGTGHRRQCLGIKPAEREFAGFLLASMDAMVDVATGDMRSKLR